MPQRKPSPFVELLADLARTADKLGVRWYVFGAQAALLYGSARLTADVDATVLLGEVTPTRFTRALRRAGFDLRVSDPKFVRTTRVLPVIHRKTGIPADLVLGGPGLEEAFLERAVLHDLGRVRVPVARREDLIVMKVLAGREKDRDDVLAMLRAGGSDVDLDGVRSTLKLIESALSQNDLVPAFETWRKAASRAQSRKRARGRSKPRGRKLRKKK